MDEFFDKLKNFLVGGFVVYGILIVLSVAAIYAYNWWDSHSIEYELHRDERSPMPFDSSAWKQAKWSPDNQDGFFNGTRQKMLKDLFAKHNLAGMSVEEVRALLGPFDTKPNLSKNEFYELGSLREEGKIYLELKIEDGKVDKYHVWHYLDRR